VACRALNVSRSGYYDWKDRPLSDRDAKNELLTKHIVKIHADSRETYGWPRVHAELTLGLGWQVNHKRVGPAHARRRCAGTLSPPHPPWSGPAGDRG
jgi:putative transposase